VHCGSSGLLTSWIASMHRMDVAKERVEADRQSHSCLVGRCSQQTIFALAMQFPTSRNFLPVSISEVL
jgi:hypothetical protein